MEKIVIKQRATGEIVQEYDSALYVVGRSSAKERSRKFDRLTNEQFDNLCKAALSGTRGGKRVEAARQVMTRHISCTDAAAFAGITPSSVTQLVLQLEKHMKRYHEQQRDFMMNEPVPVEELVLPAIVKPAVQADTNKMDYHEFRSFLDQLPQSMKVRSANEGARLMLTVGTPLNRVQTSYVGADLALTQALVDKIRQMKAEKDAADILNDLE